MYRLPTCIMAVLVTCNLFAQRELFSDARSLSLAHITVFPSAILSDADNPADLRFCREPAIICSYMNRYIIPELGTQTVSGILPLKKGAISSSVDYFGSKLYNQSSVRFAYGRALEKNLSGGIRLGIFQTHIEATRQNTTQPIGEIGFLVSPCKDLFVGFQTINLWEAWMDKDHHSGLEITDIGIAYALPRNFGILGQLSQNNASKPNLAFATEYFLAKTMVIRLGTRFPAVRSYTFGIGYLGTLVAVDLGFEQHPLLGISSALSVRFNMQHHGN